MRSHSAHLVAAVLVVVGLTACVPTPAPTPTPTSTPSASATPTPSPTPTATTPPTPTPTTPPPPPTNPPPQRVTGLTAVTGGGSGEVLLTWTPNPESDIDHYIVMRSDTPGGARTRIGIVTPDQVALFPVIPFVDNDVTVGYYRVRAVDTAGQQGSSSAEVCGASYGHSC